MSLQLILYPQNYNGQYNAIGVPIFTEYASNFSFTITTFFSTYSLGTSQPWIAFHNSVQPQSLQWSGWHDDGSIYGNAPAPAISSGKIRLQGGAGGSWSGIQQLITGLTAGATYDIVFETNASTTGTLYFGTGISNWTYNGIQWNALVTLQVFSAPAAGTHTITVVAPAFPQVLDIAYYQTDGSYVDINFISVKENIISAPLTDIFSDGQVICDLYTDESIPLTLSIDEFKNVAEKAQSYSKAFDLPSTKRNNKIFSHLFDTQISVKEDAYAFNPYRKTKALLKEDGHTVFDGFLKLIDVTDKEGEVSYNVNLYSDTVTLKDTLKDKKIKDLNNGLHELTHNFNKDNIKQSFGSVGVTYTSSSTSGYRTAATVKYPLCNWNGQVTIDASDNPELLKLEDGYRPWLNCKYLVDRIFAEAGFTYTSTFLGTTDFTKLYMDFSGENKSEEMDLTHVNLNFFGTGATYGTSTTTSWQNLEVGSTWLHPEFENGTGYDITNQRFEAPQDNMQVALSYVTKIYASSTGTWERRWKKTEAGSGAITYYDQLTDGFTSGYTFTRSGVLYLSLMQGDYLELQHRQTSGSGYFAQSADLNDVYGLLYQFTTGDPTVTSNSYLQSQRGDLKQWDILKGFISMFNLVILKDKDNPTNFLIEPYKEIFIDNSNIVTHDWTSKVDIENITLEPIELKKTVSFSYVDEKDDYAKGIYKAATTVGYGDTEIDASSFTMLEGETKVSASPFGSTYIKPLFDVTEDIICPAIFKAKDDEYEGFKNKPRICYDNGQINLIGRTIQLPAQNGLTGEPSTKYLQFSHLTTIPSVSATTYDYNFGSSQLILVIGDVPVNNLYTVYWAPYYDELYNSDTKGMKIKVYLTPSEIANFNFYDIVRIKNREYRVNKIDYKAGELSTVEFILIG